MFGREIRLNYIGPITEKSISSESASAVLQDWI